MEFVEFIWLGTRQQLAKLNSEATTAELIMPLEKVREWRRDLDVVIGGELNMDAHARNVVRSCFYQLRQLRTIRSSLPMDAPCTVAVAFIASLVDYCNGVMYGVSAQVIRRLQNDGPERCYPSGRRCWQVSTHHPSSS